MLATNCSGLDPESEPKPRPEPLNVCNKRCQASISETPGEFNCLPNAICNATAASTAAGYADAAAAALPSSPTSPFPFILTSQGNQQSKSKQSSPMSNANVTLPHPAYLPSESIVLFLIKPQPPSLSASLLPPTMPACHPPTAVHWSLRVICAAASARLGRC